MGIPSHPVGTELSGGRAYSLDESEVAPNYSGKISRADRFYNNAPFQGPRISSFL